MAPRAVWLWTMAAMLVFGCAAPSSPTAPESGSASDGGLHDAGSPDGSGFVDAGAPDAGGCSSDADCAPSQYCAGNGCQGQGSCQARPQTCPGDILPACGCDGITYGNACKAHQAGVRVASNGPCASRDGGMGGDGGAGIPCGDAGTCAAGEDCFDVVVCGGAVSPDGGDCHTSFQCQSVPACGASPTCACLTTETTPCDHRRCTIETDGIVRCETDAP